ncbi:hypothetical protein EG335_18295 [Pectobacterium versatile]|nr:hypothetical protein EG335_18295 [Pectobacterium versatile]
MPSPNRQINGQLAETQKPPSDTSKYYICTILQATGTRLNAKIAGSTHLHALKWLEITKAGNSGKKKPTHPRRLV